MSVEEFELMHKANVGSRLHSMGEAGKEIHKYLKKVDGWDVKSNDDKSFYLIKDFKFNNFEESTTRLGF